MVLKVFLKKNYKRKCNFQTNTEEEIAEKEIKQSKSGKEKRKKEWAGLTEIWQI